MEQPPTRRDSDHFDTHSSSTTSAPLELEKDIEKAEGAPDADAPPTPSTIYSATTPASPAQQQPPRDPNLVDWSGPSDPENPQNWPQSKKWTVTMVLSLMTVTMTFASSVFSTATLVVAAEFHISLEVSTLGTSLFVLGFAFGPLIFGPLSEIYGRKRPLFFGYFIFTIFQIPVAVAQNVETIMLARFFGGFFGSSALSIIAGLLADFWDPVMRGVAIACFSGATFLGPAIGPILGGFVTQSHLGWRWTAWLTLIMAGSFSSLAVLIVPETYGPLLLQRRAAKLRIETRNWALHSKLDESSFTLSDISSRYLIRPFQMLVLEPILILITIYLALVYGILYLFFEAYPICFQEQRGWNLGVGALPFLGITVGVIFGGIYMVYTTKTRFAAKMAQHGRVVPEERLPPMIVGGILLPVGLFWFAWTSSPHITWVPQVIAGVPIGAGIFMILMQGFNYLIDVYLMTANSALAANTVVRSLAGAGFPLFATQMYNKLGVAWATSLLGFLCVAMAPIPLLFFIYGKRIRALSKFSPKF